MDTSCFNKERIVVQRIHRVSFIKIVVFAALKACNSWAFLHELAPPPGKEAAPQASPDLEEPPPCSPGTVVYVFRRVLAERADNAVSVKDTNDILYIDLLLIQRRYM